MLHRGRRAAAGAGPPPLEIAFQQTDFSNADASGYSFSNEGIGSAPATGKRRFVFVAIGTLDTFNSVTNINSVTIGGSSAMVVGVDTHQASDHVLVGWAYREVSTGTTATVVVNFNAVCDWCAIATYTVTSGEDGISVGTAGTDDTPSSGVCSTTVNVNAKGAVLAHTHNHEGGTTTWSGDGVVEDFDNDVFTQDYHSGASAETTADDTSFSVTATSSDTTPDGMALSVVPINPL